MKAKLKCALQKFSAALIIPIRILPVIGLLLALSNIFTHPVLINQFPVLEDSLYTQFFSVFSQSLVRLLDYLGLVFAVGIAAGLAHKEKAEAGFIGLLSYIVFIFAMHLFMDSNGLLITETNLIGTGQTTLFGVQVFNLGILPGVLIGITTALIFNQLKNKELPKLFQIYNGTPFIMIILLPMMTLLASTLSSIWPTIQNSLFSLSQAVKATENLGFFLYGTIERLSILTGLQNLVYTPFLYTSLGGVEEVGGVVFEGARNIYFAEMADPTVSVLSNTVILDARGISKMFGLIGACLAMYHTAKPENKAKTRAILIPAAFTSFIAGVTEPIEFSFLFITPILFVLHSVLSGLSMVALNLLNVRAIGPNGFIDFLLYNVPLGLEKTRWPFYILVGLLFFVLYYVIFRFAITKFNLKTIGREENGEETKLYSKQAYQEKKAGEESIGEADTEELELALTIVQALGGPENIQTLTNCYSRLRLTVEEPEQVDEAVLKNETGATGVVINEKNVQIVYGLQVNKIRQNVADYLNRKQDED